MGERRIVKGWIVERGADGSLVPIAPAGGQAGPPRDPTFDLQAPKAQADIYNTQTNARGNEIDNSIKGQTAPYTVREAAAKAAAAEAAAKEAQDKIAKGDLLRKSASEALLANINAADQVSSHLKDSGGFGEVGATSWLARSRGTDPSSFFYSGSRAADFDGMIDPLTARTALDRVMQMRAESPTGAGMGGNTTDKDIELLKQVSGSLKPSQSPEAFQRSLGTARSAYVRNLRNIDRAAGNRMAVNNPSMTGTDAYYALTQGFQSLRQQMEGKAPEERARMLQSFNADPNVQMLKQRAGFRDPGGRRSAPRRAGNVIRYDAQGNRI